MGKKMQQKKSIKNQKTPLQRFLQGALNAYAFKQRPPQSGKKGLE